MKKILRDGNTWLVVVTFVLITVTGIMFSQKWYRMLPLYISLFVMIMQTHANRYNFLLGGVNSIFYAIVYYALGLYGMAVYAVMVSFPLQIITFIRWNKHAYGNSTVLKRLPRKTRIISAVAFVAVWSVCYIALSAVGSGYVILDNTITILGIASTVCSLLSLIEFPFLQIAGQIISIILYIGMMKTNPEQITYLIFSCYSLICSSLALVYMSKLYITQHKEKKNETCLG